MAYPFLFHSEMFDEIKTVSFLKPTNFLRSVVTFQPGMSCRNWPEEEQLQELQEELFSVGIAMPSAPPILDGLYNL